MGTGAKGMAKLYSGRTGEYLGKRRIYSRMDKATGWIYFFVNWNGRQRRFTPNITELLDIEKKKTLIVHI